MLMGGSEPSAPPAAASATVESVADPAPAAVAATEPAGSTATPAPDPVAPTDGDAETAAATTDTAPAPAIGVPQPVADAPAADAEPTPVADTAPEDPVADPAPEVAAEPATETATETAAADPAPAAPPVALQENQIGFAAWDAEMPFIEDNRIIGGERVAIILRLLPNVEVADAGDWLANGLILHSVNGVDIQQSGSITTAVLNAMKVDPDGKARVVVQYSGSSLERQTGLMTVHATRRVSLANGVNVTTSTVEGEWKTVVTGVTAPGSTQLRQGDVLFRDKTTGVALDGPTSLETIMAALVEQGTPETEFSIIRDNKLSTATMQLATKAGQ
jgi:hypothetical protein